MRKTAGEGGLSVARDGRDFGELDARLRLTEVRETPSVETVTAARAVRTGLFPAFSARKSLEVTLTVFAKAWEARERARLYGELCAFFRPGRYAPSWRAGQVLAADAARVQALPSLTAWTSCFTVTLTAFLLPYYMDGEMTVQAFEGREILETLHPPGTAGVLTQVRCTNLGALPSGLFLAETLQGESRLSMVCLQGHSQASGEALEIGWDAHFLERVTLSGQSAMAFRTRGSSDRLCALPSQETVFHLLSDRMCRMEVGFCGLYD